MQQTIRHHWIMILFAFVGLTSCEHEIDFDYPTAEPMVVFEGQVSNEDVSVRISHTRPMADSTKNHYIGNAQVWVASDDGQEELLTYDEHEHCYKSPTGMRGVPGHTYKMRATVDGHHYEATSTMPPKAKVDTAYFRYIEALSMRVYMVCVKGLDPYPDERNYYLYRLMRGDEVFRWSQRSGRSNIDGVFEYDIICSSDDDMEKEVDDDGKIPLRDGDTLEVIIMTIDRPAWLYFQSLSMSNRTTDNPLTNIQGGAQGVFMATAITRYESIVFDKEKLLKEKK